MPVIYYTYYTPVSDAVAAVSAQEHRLGRELLDRGLKELYHIECPSLGTENGKPYLIGHPEIQFNISHCSGLVVCAFHNAPVGVDVELPGYFADILIKRAFTGAEALFFRQNATDEGRKQEWFFRFWTLKEAYVKCSGIGVDTDLKAFSFTFSGSACNPAEAVSWEPTAAVVRDFTEYPGVQCSDPAVLCFQVLLSHGQILSLCCRNNSERITSADIRLIGHSSATSLASR